MFRVYRARHLDKLVSSFDKLGLTGKPHCSGVLRGTGRARHSRDKAALGNDDAACLGRAAPE